ncbi:MAG: site-specific integrase [Roseiarcus sp.]
MSPISFPSWTGSRGRLSRVVVMLGLWHESRGRSKARQAPQIRNWTTTLHLIVLTMVRTVELRGARWDEFDLDKRVWLIPEERMKMRAPHLVPLSRQALEILDELRPITGACDLVFPGRSDRRKPISENTLLYALYRMGYHQRATTHGFRALASTILNESGLWRPDAIERQLAHKEQNAVRAAYHRSEYLEERVRMMQWWADFLDASEREAADDKAA